MYMALDTNIDVYACVGARQNFIALFAHSTFTVRSQNTIYSGYP